MLASRDGVRIGEGITLVHQRYGHEMAHRIRARFRGLQPDDVGDIWRNTLVALARSACEGRFKEEGSLPCLVWRITKFRALDFLREKNRRRQCQQELQESMGEDCIMQFDVDIPLEDLLDAIRAAIETLSGRQRAVLLAFANTGFDRHDEDFVSEASRLAGRLLTRAQVCEALSNGLKKVAEYLRRRGYE